MAEAEEVAPVEVGEVAVVCAQAEEAEVVLRSAAR